MKPTGRADIVTVIAIDGPAGSGKSTVAQALADSLGLVYADSGKLYRALALKFAEAGPPISDIEAVRRFCEETKVQFKPFGTQTRVFLDARDVTEELTASEAVGELASALSAIPRVRELLLPVQRALARPPGVVMEGRDIGTVVFPDATFKFYLDASLEERARRRLKDLLAKGDEITLEDVITRLRRRDERDGSRAVAPLRKAEDAVYVDTTDLTFDEVVARLVRYVRGENADA